MVVNLAGETPSGRMGLKPGLLKTGAFPVEEAGERESSRAQKDTDGEEERRPCRLGRVESSGWRSERLAYSWLLGRRAEDAWESAVAPTPNPS